MKRRDFLKSMGAGLAIGAGFSLEALGNPLANPQAPFDLVAVMGGEPEVMFEKGIAALGGMGRFVKAGQKVALVGATGAGKTTIVNLLARFYDANAGTVYIDGLDIKQYKRDSLRRAFSVVLQDTCLFTGTIADNIRYGRPEATDEDVAEAAKAANADAFIRRLKNGYGTVVRGDTDSLSQGQRQLLAIARAALCRAPILILDEATSSVDTRTEKRIQEALLRLTAGCTSFVIAHRLSTIRDADVIMVVEGGKIAESGAHEELLAQGEIYAKMYESQVGG
jgi:ATP-binding cassette subfamily B protein